MLIDDFHKRASGTIGKIPVHRIREVSVIGNPHFPLEEYAWARESDPGKRDYGDDNSEDEQWFMIPDASADDNPDLDSIPQIQDASSSGAAASSSQGATSAPGASSPREAPRPRERAPA